MRPLGHSFCVTNSNGRESAPANQFENPFLCLARPSLAEHLSVSGELSNWNTQDLRDLGIVAKTSSPIDFKGLFCRETGEVL